MIIIKSIISLKIDQRIIFHLELYCCSCLLIDQMFFNRRNKCIPIHRSCPKRKQQNHFHLLTAPIGNHGANLFIKQDYSFQSHLKGLTWYAITIYFNVYIRYVSGSHWRLFETTLRVTFSLLLDFWEYNITRYH